MYVVPTPIANWSCILNRGGISVTGCISLLWCAYECISRDRGKLNFVRSLRTWETTGPQKDLGLTMTKKMSLPAVKEERQLEVQRLMWNIRPRRRLQAQKMGWEIWWGRQQPQTRVGEREAIWEIRQNFDEGYMGPPKSNDSTWHAAYWGDTWDISVPEEDQIRKFEFTCLVPILSMWCL